MGDTDDTKKVDKKQTDTRKNDGSSAEQTKDRSVKECHPGHPDHAEGSAKILAEQKPTDTKDVIRKESDRIQATCGVLPLEITGSVAATSDVSGPKGQKDKSASDNANQVQVVVNALMISTGATDRAQARKTAAEMPYEPQRQIALRGAERIPVDLNATIDLLDNKSGPQRQAIEEAFQKQSGESLEHLFKAHLKGADLEKALSVLKRDSRDPASQRADSVALGLAELKNTWQRRSTREIAREMIGTYAASTSGQLNRMEQAFAAKHQDPDGKPLSLQKTIDQDANLPQATKDALSILRRHGADGRTDQDVLDLTKIALKTKDIGLFEIAWKGASKEARAKFLGDGGPLKMAEAFGEKRSQRSGRITYEQTDDLQHAQDYLRYGKISAISAVHENTGLSNNVPELKLAVEKMSPEERRIWQLGKDLNDPEKKDAAGKNVSDADKKQALEYYAKMSKELDRTGLRPELEDKIKHPPEGTLVSVLAERHRGNWYEWNSSAETIKKDLQTNIKDADLIPFQKDPELKKDLGALFKDLGKNSQEVDSLMQTFDARLREKEQSDNEKANQAKLGVLKQLLDLPPQARLAYSTTPLVQEAVDAQVRAHLGDGLAGELGEKMLTQMKAGEPPFLSTTDQLRMNAAMEHDPAAALRVVEERMNADRNLRRRLLHPQGETETKWSQSFMEALRSATPGKDRNGVQYSDRVDELLRFGVASKGDSFTPDALTIATWNKIPSTTLAALDRAAVVERPGTTIPYDPQGAERMTGWQASFEAVRNMPPEEQSRYRLDNAFRDNVNEKLSKNFKDAPTPYAYATEQLLNQIRCGQPPSADVVGKLLEPRTQEDSIRDIAQSFKDNPSLSSKISNPQSDDDRKLSAAFRAAAVMALPSKLQFARDLMDHGYIPLERMALLDQSAYGKFDLQKTTADILAAPDQEKQRLKNEPDYRDNVFKGLGENQRQVLLNALDNGGLSSADKVRWYQLEGNGPQMLAATKEIKIEDLNAEASKFTTRYGSDFQSAVLGGLSGEQKEDAERYFKQTEVPEVQADLVRYQASLKLSGPGPDLMKSLFNSATKDMLVDSTVQTVGAEATYAKAVMAAAEQNATPEELAKLQAQVGAVQDQLKQTVAQTVEAGKLLDEAKADAANAVTNVTLGVIGVGGIIVTGGASTPLMLQLGVLGGCVKIGSNALFKGQSWDNSARGLTTDFSTGFAYSVANVLGPGEVAAAIGIGKTVGIKTGEAIAGSALKDVVNSTAREQVSKDVQGLIQHKLTTGGGGIEPKELQAIAEKAIPTEITGAERQAKVAELTGLLTKSVEKEWGEGVKGWAQTLANHGFNTGAAVAGTTFATTIEGITSGDSIEDIVRKSAINSGFAVLGAEAMLGSVQIGGKVIRTIRGGGTEAASDAGRNTPSGAPRDALLTESHPQEPFPDRSAYDAQTKDVREKALQSADPKSDALRSRGGPAEQKYDSKWNTYAPAPIEHNPDFIRETIARYPELGQDAADRLYKSLAEGARSFNKDIPELQRQARDLAAVTQNRWAGREQAMQQLRGAGIEESAIKDALTNEESQINKQMAAEGKPSLFQLNEGYLKVRDDHVAKVQEINEEREARRKVLEPIILNWIRDDLKLPVRSVTFEGSRPDKGSYISGNVTLNQAFLDGRYSLGQIAQIAHHEVIHLKQDEVGIRAAYAMASQDGVNKTEAELLAATRKEYQNMAWVGVGDDDWLRQVVQSSAGKPPVSSDEAAHAMMVLASGRDYGNVAAMHNAADAAHVIGSFGQKLEADQAPAAVHEIVQRLAQESLDGNQGGLARSLFGGLDKAPSSVQEAVDNQITHPGTLPQGQTIETLRADLVRALEQRMQSQNQIIEQEWTKYSQSLLEQEAQVAKYLHANTVRRVEQDGKLLEAYHENGHSIKYSYDEHGQFSQATLNNGDIVVQRTDAGWRLTNAKTHEEIIGADASIRPSGALNFRLQDGTHRIYFIDTGYGEVNPKGQFTRIVDGKGRESNFEYDKQGLVHAKIYDGREFSRNRDTSWTEVKGPNKGDIYLPGIVQVGVDGSVAVPDGHLNVVFTRPDGNSYNLIPSTNIMQHRLGEDLSIEFNVSRIYSGTSAEVPPSLQSLTPPHERYQPLRAAEDGRGAGPHGDQPGANAQALAALKLVSDENPHLQIPVERLADATPEALQFYKRSAGELTDALKDPPPRDLPFGTRYQFAAEVLISDTMRAPHAEALKDWVFIPTGYGSAADKMGMDGLMLNVRDNRIVPVDIKSMREQKGDNEWTLHIPARDMKRDGTFVSPPSQDVVEDILLQQIAKRSLKGAYFKDFGGPVSFPTLREGTGVPHELNSFLNSAKPVRGKDDVLDYFVQKANRARDYGVAVEAAAPVMRARMRDERLVGALEPPTDQRMPKLTAGVEENLRKHSEDNYIEIPVTADLKVDQQRVTAVRIYEHEGSIGLVTENSKPSAKVKVSGDAFGDPDIEAIASTRLPKWAASVAGPLSAADTQRLLTEVEGLRGFANALQRPDLRDVAAAAQQGPTKFAALREAHPELTDEKLQELGIFARSFETRGLSLQDKDFLRMQQDGVKITEVNSLADSMAIYKDLSGKDVTYDSWRAMDKSPSVQDLRTMRQMQSTMKTLGVDVTYDELRDMMDRGIEPRKLPIVARGIREYREESGDATITYSQYQAAEELRAEYSAVGLFNNEKTELLYDSMLEPDRSRWPAVVRERLLQELDRFSRNNDNYKRLLDQVRTGSQPPRPSTSTARKSTTRTNFESGFMRMMDDYYKNEQVERKIPAAEVKVIFQSLGY